VESTPKNKPRKIVNIKDDLGGRTKQGNAEYVTEVHCMHE
jgi:hypothetical protein